MDTEHNENSFQELFKNAKSIVIVIPPDPSDDLINASLCLNQSFLGMDKSSFVGCGVALPNHPEVKDSIGSKNLIISLNYQEQHLDKVDYDVLPSGHFRVVIRPKEGSPLPEANNVTFSYSGANADLVVVMGIGVLEELGPIYADEKKFIDNAKILSLNITNLPVSFTGNIYHHQSASFSELVGLFLEKTQLPLTSDSASSLLRFIHRQTKAFSDPRVTAQTFATISYLMTKGGKLPLLEPFQPKSVFQPNLASPPFFENNSQSTSVPNDWQAPKIFRSS